MHSLDRKGFVSVPCVRVLTIFLSLVVCHWDQGLHISFLPDYSPECFWVILDVMRVIRAIKMFNHKDFAYARAWYWV
jgi:hypothetical protein